MTWKAQKAFMALSRQLETTGLSRFELRRLGSIGNAIEIQIEEGYGNSEAVWVAQPRIKPKEIPRRSESSGSSSSGFTRRSKADLRICCQSRKATSHRRFCIDASVGAAAQRQQC